MTTVSPTRFTCFWEHNPTDRSSIRSGVESCFSAVNSSNRGDDGESESAARPCPAHFCPSKSVEGVRHALRIHSSARVPCLKYDLTTSSTT